MDFYGNIDMLNNEMQQMVFQSKLGLPETTAVGGIVFTGNKLYMCIALNGAAPIWMPITNTVNTHIHDQEVASASWTITHNLGYTNLIVQVYDENNIMILPDAVDRIDANNLSITLNASIIGRAIMIYGDEAPINLV